MKKSVCLPCLLLLFAFCSQAQESTDPEFTGTWKVKEVSIDEGLNQQVQNMMLMMKKGFQNAQFVFGSDGKFTLKPEGDVPPMMTEMMSFLNGEKWTYDRQKKKIEVGAGVLVLFVKETDNQYYFDLSDTPITLQMDKF